jgi:hypothetical protein
VWELTIFQDSLFNLIAKLLSFLPVNRLIITMKQCRKCSKVNNHLHLRQCHQSLSFISKFFLVLISRILHTIFWIACSFESSEQRLKTILVEYNRMPGPYGTENYNSIQVSIVKILHLREKMMAKDFRIELPITQNFDWKEILKIAEDEKLNFYRVDNHKGTLTLIDRRFKNPHMCREAMSSSANLLIGWYIITNNPKENENDKVLYYSLHSPSFVTHFCTSFVYFSYFQ